jgi:hypothetical protein
VTDAHHEIEELEAEIADLSASAEQCRKTMIIAKLGIATGGMLVPLIMIGVLRFGPVALIASVTVVIGGIVAFGSTKSTRDGLLNMINQLEQRRAEMIDHLQLRNVQPTGEPRELGRRTRAVEPRSADLT